MVHSFLPKIICIHWWVFARFPTPPLLPCCCSPIFGLAVACHHGEFLIQSMLYCHAILPWQAIQPELLQSSLCIIYPVCGLPQPAQSLSSLLFPEHSCPGGTCISLVTVVQCAQNYCKSWSGGDRMIYVGASSWLLRLLLWGHAKISPGLFPFCASCCPRTSICPTVSNRGGANSSHSQ